MSRKAEPAANPQDAETGARDGATDPLSPDWTTRLADLLLDPPDAAQAQDELRRLWSAHSTGTAEVDANRLALLGHLGRHLVQRARPPLTDLPSPLPDWPDADHSPLPQLHPTGQLGASLVTLCQGNAEALLDSLDAWLMADVQDIVIVALANGPALAAELRRRWPRPDPRLRLAEIASPGVTLPQGWNAGLRLALGQRLICLAPGMALPDDHLHRAGPPPGHFGLCPGPGDGSGFLLDLDRADLAALGGFNEFLPTMDFCVEELRARLIARGLAPWHITQPVPALPPPIQSPQNLTLREALSERPALAALCNRHIAALMPDWQAGTGRAFGFAGAGELGPRLAATGEAALTVPVTILGTAQARALSDLVSAHLGLPVLLGQRRIEMVLARPAADVCAMDVAVAGSLAPDAVRTRRAWLALDIEPDAFPAADSLARTAFLWLRQRAEVLGLSLVLRTDAQMERDLPDHLADLPQVPRDPALTQGFWPATLRDLAHIPDGDDQPLPHATLNFDLGFLDDHAAFIQRGPAIFVRRPKLFVDVQHGLGNRMRAMASAAAIAQATGRELIVIWQADAHCDCAFDHLFQPSGALLSEGFADQAAAMGMDLYNYMQAEAGAAKDRPLRLTATRDAYLRSAYPLVHPASTWHSENLALRQFRPSEVVLDLVQSLPDHRPDLAVHIRMEGGKAAEHLAYEAPSNWTAAAHLEIDHWRRRSHYSRFLPRLDALVAEGQAQRIFLASDTPSVYALLSQRYGSRLTFLPRPITDRSAAAMVHAFADAILLSRAPRLLGSTFSSFTELAARLSDTPIALELSGRDF